MKKSELIALLEKIPGDPCVAIIDAWTVSQVIEVEGADQISKGIHDNLDVQYFHGTDVPAGNLPFIGISFFAQPKKDNKPELVDLMVCNNCNGTGKDSDLLGIPCPFCQGIGYGVKS